MTVTESDNQFLARMIIASREGHQIASRDAQRLNNLATFGDSLPRGEATGATTMPEERRQLPAHPDPAGVRDVVRG